MKLNFIIMACALIITGCSPNKILTSTQPQQTIYTLRPVETTAMPSNATARVVEIATPSLPPGMDTDRIALFLENGQKVDYYAAARWSAPLRYILQDFTRRNAIAVLPYVVPVTPEQNIQADYRLQMKINEFQPVYETSYEKAPLIKVNVEFSMVHVASDKIISSFTLSKQEQASENRLDIIMAGLERILQEIERDAFIRLDKKMQVAQ